MDLRTQEIGTDRCGRTAMTSRQRVMAALNHREPDRVAVDLGAMRSTGIQAVAYNRLKAYLGQAGGQTRVYDLIQQLAEPEAWALERFGIDAMDVGWDWPGEVWKDWALPDGSIGQVPGWFNLVRPTGPWQITADDGTLIAEMPEGCFYFTQKHWPLERNGITDENLRRLPELMPKVMWAVPSPIWKEGLSDANLDAIARRARHLHETTDRALMIGFGGNLFEWGTFLLGLARFLEDLMLERAKVERLLDRLVEIHLSNLDRLLPRIAGTVDIIQLGDDLGTESGPFFSPQIYREVFRPRHATIINHIKKHSGLKVFLHSCGSIYKLLPDLIEAGFEVVNPVQTSAADMDPVRLKREFGREIAFWGGGCDTQRVLPRGTPQQVYDDVKRRVEILAPGGGFVFTQVHNILAEVPPANVEAMFKALDDLRGR